MNNLKKSNNSSKYGLQSVETTLRILDLFYRFSELGPTDVSEQLEINKSTAFRMLTTLAANNFLVKTEKGRYRLSIKLYSLGQLAYSHTMLVSYAKPQLIKLAETFSETANLSVLDGHEGIIFLDKITPSSPLMMDTNIGHRYPINATASGKSLIAFQAQSVIKEFLDTSTFVELTENTIISAKVFNIELMNVRKQGWSSDNEECIPGLTCFAAPIIERSGISVAALSLSGVTTRMKLRQKEITESVKESARTISKMLW